MRPRTTLPLVAAWLTWACTPEAPPPDRPDAGYAPDAGEGERLGCPEIFDCFAECDDAPCEDGCLARATPEGLELAVALAACAEGHGCETEECLAARCEAELYACAGAEPPGCPDRPGFPELTAPLGGLATAYARGDDVVVRATVDEDTRHLRFAIYDYGTTTSLVQNWAKSVEPSSTTTATINIPGGTSAPPGSYYLTVELCSTEACASPTQRSVYRREGSGAEYGQTRETLPIAMTDGPCPTGIPIAPFTIE